MAINDVNARPSCYMCDAPATGLTNTLREGVPVEGTFTKYGRATPCSWATYSVASTVYHCDTHMIREIHGREGSGYYIDLWGKITEAAEEGDTFSLLMYMPILAKRRIIKRGENEQE